MVLDLPTTEYVKLRERLEDLVISVYLSVQQWPTVATVARSLKIGVKDVNQLIDDSDELMLEYYLGYDPPLGKYFIYSTRSF